MMSTKAQVQLIHIAKAKLGIDEATYRDMLLSRYRVESSLKLSANDAADFLKLLAKMGFERARKEGSTRFNELRGRRFMASPEQLRKIEAMWADMCDAPNKAAALRKFLFRMVRVSDLRFLDGEAAHKMIDVLQKIQTRKETTEWNKRRKH